MVLALAACPAFVLRASAAGAEQTAPKSKGKAVVVSDVSTDATESAKLRARLYDVLRASGFEALRDADVMSAAERVGALDAGVVASDASRLSALRGALGADVLVRVTKTSEQGGTALVTVIVVSEGGPGTRNVQAPKGDPGAAVVPALEELLGKAPAAAEATPPAETDPPPAAEPEPAGDRWKVFGGQTNVQENVRTLEDPKVRREAWERRGGFRPTYEARLQLVGMRLGDLSFEETNPVTGQTDRGSGDALGIGGGVALRVGLFVLPLPDPTTSRGEVIAAFRMGIGGDLSTVFSRRPIGFTYKRNSAGGAKRSEDEENETLFFANVPLQVAIHFGFGRYHGNDTWRGVMLGVAYSPTLQYELNLDRAFGSDETGGRENDTRFNYGGAEVTLDITTLRAHPDRADPDPAIRIAAQVLPPLEADWPLIVALGLGAAWY